MKKSFFHSLKYGQLHLNIQKPFLMNWLNLQYYCWIWLFQRGEIYVIKNKLDNNSERIEKLSIFS